MNVLQNLTVFYNQLAPDSTYRNVCRGILEHLNEAAEGTVYDLAELTNSSRTTIWRMIQKLGYESFTDFHHELKRAVKNYTYYNRILPAEDCTTAHNVKNALLSQMFGAYESMKADLDAGAVEAVAERLYSADKVRFYMPFQSSSIYSLQQNLAMSGVETAFYCLIPELLEDSRQLTENSIVFINTIEHAETMDLKPVFESIKKQNAVILGLTLSNSKYREYIDQELLGDENGKIVERLMAFDIYFYMLSEIYRMKYIMD
ncbi:hypothetical protein GCM10008910_28310 [Faecalicatena orotica]|uniref:RpiR family transcriptional regulator n=1 Tax=Faecalicatena orotica TaxID=1544 RepID=A0A2Y9BF38_9FIRM|nr:MurR/RpiR family transcriptional regulator [Faecalicatena orotica]PWJ28943.1 RpiR family transcriptional regulator [Faecalicatena orotica]SSA56112.1 transcriptional regulator, RpiR family [Faecalicatena orotica]